MKAYTLTTPELNEKTGKTYWTDIGVLFADESATGINGASIKLSMFPNLTIKVYNREKKHRDTHDSGDVDTEPIDGRADDSYDEPSF
jgi:hypothetical protein